MKKDTDCNTVLFLNLRYTAVLKQFCTVQQKQNSCELVTFTFLPNLRCNATINQAHSSMLL